ncbi:hypothetical protein FACS189429_4210 [Bacteroidia bacterium]|nr:hypothetical protein FACS189429_4210 [Bacteroidia bacterium]GHV43163.1 hypothetical protein FACS1894180_1450 [Bacteroidia bacterium]
MKKRNSIFFILLIINILNVGSAQNVEKRKIPEGGALLKIEILPSGDTVYLADIQGVHVFPRVSYTATREQFFWKTVRDIKKTLPLAKIVGEEIAKTNRILVTLKTDKERKEYLDVFEKQVFDRYEPTIRDMTRSQGKMLIKLIDRECQLTSYDIIRIYKGSVTAFFWQGIARIFRADLKAAYDPEGEDKQLERIIELVEAGQL